MRFEHQENGPERLYINEIPFELDYTDYTRNTTEGLVILCKPRRMLETYLEIFSSAPHARILELGIFQGGSSLFFGTMLKTLEKLVAIDISPEKPEIVDSLRKHSLNDKLSLLFNTRQDDPALIPLVMRELGGLPDIIIDDCSHMYAPSKISFQMLFPLLAPGGLYIIEDWNWSHVPSTQAEDAWAHNKPALTNLIFDLIALQGSHTDWIANLTLHSYGGMAIIQKGTGTVDNPLDITAASLLRNKAIGYI